MNYAKVNLFDIANGEGIRVSLFVSGCKFHCPQCFNQDLWNYSYGAPYTSKIENIILNRLNDDRFKGLSILGGDPLWQTNEDIEELIKLCEKVHALNKDVWIWSGYTWEEIFNSDNQYKKDLIKNCDIFIDGKFENVNKDLSLAWRGSINQRVINVKESLKNGKILLYL